MYCLYRHVRLDKNEVFYIGIGSLSRPKSKRNRNIYWKRIVNISEYRVDILYTSDSKDFILQKEIEFIKLYGRKNLGMGTLCNMTDGGDGISGYVFNEDQRKFISNRTRGELNPNYGVKHTEETRKNLSIIAKNRFKYKHNHPSWGKKHSDETKDIISKKAKKRFEENGARKGWKHTEEARQKMSLSRKGKPLSAKTREASIIKMRTDNPHRKKVINIDTLKIWESAIDCSQDNNINYSTLRHNLNPKNKNYSRYMYLTEYKKK